MNLQTAFKRVVVAAAAMAILAQGASATDVTWDGDLGTDWSTPANWVGDVAPPSSADNAVITGTFTNQPTLPLGTTLVGGVWITGLGQALGAVVNGETLRISGNTINSIHGLAVLFDNTTGFDAKINNRIEITNSLTIRNETDKALTIAAVPTTSPVIQLNANTLTLSNTGAGAINVGHIGGSGNVIVDSTGTGVVDSGSGNTSFTGQLTVKQGILSTNSFGNYDANGKLGHSTLSVILGSSGKTGTLFYYGAVATYSKTFTMAPGGTGAFDIQPAAAATVTLTGLIDGSGTLEMKSGNGLGILSLNNTVANSYTGGTILTSGTLALGTAGALGTTGTISFDGGTLRSTSGNPTDYSARFSNAANQAYNLDINGSGTTVALATGLTSVGGTLTKSGSGTLTLNAANSYDNGTTLAAGTLTLGHGLSLGTTGTISLTGGTLKFSGSNTTDYSLRFNTAASQQYKFDTNGQAVTLATDLSSVGGVLTKSGTGTLTLSAANTFTGSTTVSAGTLLLKHQLALQNSTLTTAGVAFDQTVSAFTLGGLSGSGLIALVNNAGSPAPIALSVGNNDASTSYTGALSGAGSLVKIGSGTLTLSLNTHSGGTTLTSGGLQVTNNSAFGTGGLRLSGGFIQAGTASNNSLSNVLAIDGGTTFSASTSSNRHLTFTGGGTISGTPTLTFNDNASGTAGGTQFTTGALTLNSDVTLNGTGLATISSVINEDASPRQITKSGTSTVILSGASTYTGGTKLVSGTLSIGGSTTGPVTPGPVGKGNLTLAGGTLTTNSSTARTIANPIITEGTATISPVGSLTLTGSFTTNGTVNITSPGAEVTLTGPLSSTNNTDTINTTTGGQLVYLNGNLSGYGGIITFDRGGNGLRFATQDVDLSKAKLVMNGSTASGGSQIRIGDNITAGPATFKIGELFGGGGVINPEGSSTSQTYEIGSRNTNADFGGILHGRPGVPVNVTKVGTGSLTMTAANYASGTYTVSAGTLIAGRDAISTTTMDGTNLNLSIANGVFTQIGHGLTDGDRIAFSTGVGTLVTVTQYYVRNATDDTFEVSTASSNTPLTGITAVAGVTRGEQGGAFGGGATPIVLGDAQTVTGIPTTTPPNVTNNSVSILTGGGFTIERAINVTDTGSTGTAAIGGLSTENSTFSGLVTLNRDLTVAQNTDGGTLNVTGGLTAGSLGLKTITFGSTTVVPVAAPNGFLGAVNVGTAGIGTGITDGSGQVAVKVNGNTTTFSLPNTYTGNTVVSAGTLALSGNGSFANSPVIQVDSGSTLNVSALTGGANHDGTRFSLLNGQTLKGNGTVIGGVDAAAGSIIAPGASIGTLGIDALTLASGSLLNFELGAPGAPGVTSDLINVVSSDGFIANGGAFNFTNAGGLAAGTYTLIDYSGTLGGDINSLTVAGLPYVQPAGFTYALSNNLDNTSIDLTVAVVPSGLLGDYNGDTVVDSADYVFWRKGAIPVAANDATPGTNDPSDYAVWRAHFGNSSPGSGSGSALGSDAGNVPEPGAILLAIVGCLGLIVSRRTMRGR